jgi:hypothetical protein
MAYRRVTKDLVSQYSGGKMTPRQQRRAEATIKRRMERKAAASVSTKRRNGDRALLRL